MLLLMEQMRFYLWLNYVQRGDSGSFRTIPEFLEYGNVKPYAQTSSEQLAKDWGINWSTIWKTWVPLSRDIYDQNLSVNGKILWMQN